MTVKVTTASGKRRPLEARQVQNGLALTPALEADQRRGKYRVTHLASGLGIGYFPNLPIGRAGLAALLALPIDWTQGKDSIVTQENAARCREALDMVARDAASR